mgnify:CR=1 FL=1
MGRASGHRKQVRHYNDPGHIHELTFSCYRRLPLLTTDAWRAMLAESIDRATNSHRYRLTAFVFMPEHVHWLVYPLAEADTIDALLKATIDTQVNNVGRSKPKAPVCRPPVSRPPDIPLLYLNKRPFSYRVKQLLLQSQSKLLERLTVQQRPGVKTFRFWQEGPGYDRNVTKPSTVLAAMDYLHHNPVRRQLVTRAVDWQWSSARYYLVDPPRQYPPLPTVHRLPGEWLDSTD